MSDLVGLFEIKSQYQHQHPQLIRWKGSTLTRIVSTIQKNKNTGYNIFSKRPLKHYRREIGGGSAAATTNNEHISLKISSLTEQPGGTITNSGTVSTTNNGVPITEDITSSTNLYETGNCARDSALCDNSAFNARRRVRSSGMIKKASAVSSVSATRSYYTDSKQYLNSRNISFEENQFNYLKSGTSAEKPGSAPALKLNNTYRPNGENTQNNIVIFKPSNYKFSTQGGVSSSSRLDRLKYDTIQKIEYNQKQQYGTSANYALQSTYNNNNLWGLKTQSGFSNTLTPKISLDNVMIRCAPRRIYG
jgi:hypothetical protein